MKTVRIEGNMRFFSRTIIASFSFFIAAGISVATTRITGTTNHAAFDMKLELTILTANIAVAVTRSVSIISCTFSLLEPSNDNAVGRVIESESTMRDWLIGRLILLFVSQNIPGSTISCII